MELLLSLLVFASVSLLVYGLTPVARALAAPVVRDDAGGREGPPRSVTFMALKTLLRALAPVAGLVKWPTYRANAKEALARAWLTGIVSVDELLAAKVLSAVFVPLLAQMPFAVVRNPGVFLLVAFGGFLLPDYLIKQRRLARERAIVRALPGSVDVLSLSVEAGLEFLIALQRFVERGAAGPLRDELATVLNDIRLGTQRSEALRSFASRVEIPEVSSFVSTLIQADTLGASIGPVLKNQATAMRVERFQRAEREGAKATQKILFPMILFIFPAVLLVILAPVALTFIYQQ